MFVFQIKIKVNNLFNRKHNIEVFIMINSYTTTIWQFRSLHLFFNRNKGIDGLFL